METKMNYCDKCKFFKKVWFDNDKCTFETVYEPYKSFYSNEIKKTFKGCWGVRLDYKKEGKYLPCPHYIPKKKWWRFWE